MVTELSGHILVNLESNIQYNAFLLEDLIVYLVNSFLFCGLHCPTLFGGGVEEGQLYFLVMHLRAR